MSHRRRSDHRPQAILAVDYPRPNERITVPKYILRVTAPHDSRKVEVSFDEGPWARCRPDVGFWWHEWSGYATGWHRVRARAVSSRGAVLRSSPHDFVVNLAPLLEEANA